MRAKRRARSDPEFHSKIGGALQEADESALRLELLRDDCDITTPGLVKLLTETNELLAIFATMANKTKRRGMS